MIKIGINENVILTKLAMNKPEGKKPTIDFTFSDTVSAEAAPTEINFGEEEYDEDGFIKTPGGSFGQTIKVWCLEPPKAEVEGKTVPIAQRIEAANTMTQELQNVCTLFARCYLTSDQIRFERFRGLEIGRENSHLLLQPEVLETVTYNLGTQLIEMISPFLNNADFKLRLLLRRRSEKSAYASFRDRFVAKNPFVERMETSPSTLKFADFEIKKGLDKELPKQTDAVTDIAPVIGPESVIIPPPDLSVDTALNA